ncbi:MULTISPECIES: ATP-binding protein [unclassified Caballeronia]|uniref:sensor histidine kinase n=1 Tax=unclassified Caballeronia TaxID=2646786 RepID=UPI002027CC1A
MELVAYAAGDRILIEVRDHCGGLPRGSAATMFQPFTQQSKDKSGLDMGLSITKGIIESFDGNLTVTNRPGVGCIFTINLPHHSI